MPRGHPRGTPVAVTRRIVATLESRMMGNYQVRFGGGRMEKDRPGTGEECLRTFGSYLASRLPYFACRAVGEVLREAIAVRPECEMTVLCGHTHLAGEA